MLLEAPYLARSAWAAPICVAALLLICSCGGVAHAVAVPSIVGLSEKDAVEKTAAAGLQIKITRHSQPSVRPGVIYRQSPAAGSSLRAHGVVHAVVSVKPG